VLTPTDVAPSPPLPEGERGPGGEGAPQRQPQPNTAQATLDAIKARWLDVIDHVRTRKPILGALLSSAQPISLDSSVLTVAFGTDFNRKRAELAANRQAIEAGLQHALGREFRLKCTTANSDGAPSLLEDPVINFAQRTFGGEPRRLID
jgi:hypothetical protein